MKGFILGVICGAMAVAAIGGAHTNGTGTFSLQAVQPFNRMTVNVPGTATQLPTIEARITALESRVAVLERNTDIETNCGPWHNSVRECW